MPRRDAPRFGTHLDASLRYLERIGYVPGDPSPLVDGRPVPGCACPDCQGLPADHAIRHPQPRSLPRGVILPAELDSARAVPIAGVAEDLGLQLRRSGSSRRGPCPLHQGVGPNFSVSLRTNRFHCFVCDARGDTIELVRQVRGCSFRESVAWLLGRDPAETSDAA